MCSTLKPITREISTQFRGRPCRVDANDMKVRVQCADATVCQDLLVEVLSGFTERL